MGTNASTIQKIYIAYFNRPADVAGLAYWEGQLSANKISMEGLAQSFSEQVEYRNTYGGKNTYDVVSALYQNLFGRAPDSAGLAYWVGQIDNGTINLGITALAILNGASPSSNDGISIANKLSFAQNFTASLDTQAKAASYTTSSGIDAIKLIMSKVLAGTPVPTLTSHSNLSFPSGHNTVNAIEALRGFKLDLSLSDLAVSVGYKLELMINGEPLGTPVIHTLSMAEIQAQKASILVPASIFWGIDGDKRASIKVSDIFGNTGEIGAETKFLLDRVYPEKGSSFTVRKQSDNLYHLEMIIPQGQLNGGHITLGLWETDNSVRVDTISATDKKVTFKLNEDQYRDMHFSSHFVREYDLAGNSIMFDIWDLPNALLKGSDTELTTPKNIKFTAVGGKVDADAINASNSSLIVTADIVAGEATGGHAELSFNGSSRYFLVSDSEILATDTKLTFEIKTDSPFALKSLLGDGGKAYVTLYTAAGSSSLSLNGLTLTTKYIAGEAIQGSLSAPTNIKITPLGGIVSNSNPGSVVLNGTNVAFTAEATIVPGQVTSGYAELWINNKLMAKDQYISLTDTQVTFSVTSAPLSAYSPWYLQSIVPSGGEAVVKLFDLAGHEVVSVDNFTVITNYSSLTGYDASSDLPTSDLIQIIGSQQETIF
ncbi:DUF4214 domain-containing protein [Undibacterium danionis]|uniref:DUF4214 domain-containing protein n=1 Tax=Undibacterium danionis TaxID=1812100 RepID=A0ABV6ILX1_9BURK